MPEGFGFQKFTPFTYMLDTKLVLDKFGVVQKSEGNDVDPKKVRKLNESDPKDLGESECQDNSKS